MVGRAAAREETAASPTTTSHGRRRRAAGGRCGAPSLVLPWCASYAQLITVRFGGRARLRAELGLVVVRLEQRGGAILDRAVGRGERRVLARRGGAFLSL